MVTECGRQSAPTVAAPNSESTLERALEQSRDIALKPDAQREPSTGRSTHLVLLRNDVGRYGVGMDGSTVVSSFALLVSLYALGWQLSRARWERPVVVVNGVASETESEGQERRKEYRVNVTNVGERPVTILGAGWITGLANDSVESLELPQADKVSLPARLEGHDSRSWVIVRPMCEQPHEIEGPYVLIVQRPTWREARAGAPTIRTIHGAVGTGPTLLGQPSAKPKLLHLPTQSVELRGRDQW